MFQTPYPYFYCGGMVHQGFLLVDPPLPLSGGGCNLISLTWLLMGGGSIETGWGTEGIIPSWGGVGVDIVGGEGGSGKVQAHYFLIPFQGATGAKKKQPF